MTSMTLRRTDRDSHLLTVKLDDSPEGRQLFQACSALKLPPKHSLLKSSRVKAFHLRIAALIEPLITRFMTCGHLKEYSSDLGVSFKSEG